MQENTPPNTIANCYASPYYNEYTAFLQEPRAVFRGLCLSAAAWGSYPLGFVNGVGGNKFAPDSLVTREQAATMLSRVYTKLGGNIPAVTATTFADNNSVSNWARDSVAFMANNGIVNGVGDNNFAPQGNASIEQALAIALRMIENLKCGVPLVQPD